MYFTLPMALNYQRNSYTLWECANRLYNDYPELFDSNKVCGMEFSDVKNLLVEYKVALQPDTHVIQSTLKMGLITEEELKQSDIQIIVAERWKKILENTDIVPIDIHTPMWLWSRGKFAVPLELNKKILS